MSNDQRSSHGFDRRLVIQSMLAAAIAPAALSSVRRAGAQDAAGLLRTAATTMGALKSFVFSITTIQGKSVLLGNLELQAVDGAVERPDRFKADITVGASIVSLTIKVIGVGGEVWITNPMSQDQSYIQASSGSGDSSADVLASLLNPDLLFIAAVNAIQNPTIGGTEKIDNVDTTKIQGVVDLGHLPAMGGTPVATPEAGGRTGGMLGFLDLSQKSIAAWIDATGLVHQIQIAGPFTSEESADVVRQISLTSFDQPQDIQAPS